MLYKCVLSLAVILSLSSHVQASEEGEQASMGAGYALTIVEKCTGVAPPKQYIPRLRDSMTSKGIDDDDFRKGFLAGAMSAESRYRGKPPAKECREAKAMKAVIDKTFL